MDLLVYLYDNSLIYYPNLFFVALFLLFFLAAILFLSLIPYLKALSSIGRIKKYRYHAKYPKINIKNVAAILGKNIITNGYKWIEFTELKIEKIIKKIAKEILIDEKN